MEKFDERKKSFEKKFAHDEELKFKVAAKRNKYLGQWRSIFLTVELFFLIVFRLSSLQKIIIKRELNIKN